MPGDSDEALQLFTHAVAHDLRQPLLAAAMTLGELSPDQPPDRLSFGLTVCRRALDEALTRINGLMLLARYDDPVRSERIDCTALVAGICSALEQTYPTRAVDWQVRAGMTADADPRLLTLVFQHLLDNAVKYASSDRRAQVSITSRHTTDAVVFSVADDGPGIPESLSGRIFLPYHRGNVGGTAMGLAIASRAVTRMGGTIWLERDVRTAFCFSVPGDPC